MNILIVEDNADDRRLLRYTMEHHGCTVIEARDGEEGLDLANRHHPDIIVSDALMPRMDGFQLLRALKADPHLKSIPFLFYSATYTGEQEEKLALSLGAEAFVIKPKEPEELWEKASAIMKTWETRQGIPARLDIVESEEEYLSEYGRIVATKLENKVRELEEAMLLHEQAENELSRVNAELTREIEVRKKAEQKLRASEELYASIFNNIGIGVSLISPEMEIVSMNPIMKKWFPHINVSEHPICYASFNAPPRDEVCNYCPTIHTLRDGQVHVAVTDTPIEGETRHYKIISSPVLSEEGSVSVVIEVVEDITERMRVEQMNYHLASIVESSDDAIISKTLEGVITSWNAGAERIYGYSADEVVGRPVTILAPPDQPDEIPRLLDRVRQGHSVAHYETMRVRKDGERIYVSLCISPIKDKNGSIAEVSTIARDITERKRAEEELQRANAYNRRLIEASLDPLVTIGPEGWITDANAATEEVTGCCWDELIGSDFCDYFTDPEAARSGYQKVFREGLVRDYPLKIRHRDGHTTPVLYNASVFKDEGGNVIGIFAAARDITKHIKLEAQLRQAQKMESIGTFAGGIAHDFNNILTAIVGYGYLSLMQMGDDDPHRQNIELMLEGADRAAHLTKDLLIFSRKEVSEKTPIDLNEIVRMVEKFLVRIIGEDISCSISLHGEPIVVYADSHQLEQVIMNLATNARDAMPQGGKLMIGTEQTSLGDDFVASHGYGMPGKYALLTVSDTGAGMDEDTRKKIFDPFFTTKEVGKGTGLGLAVVYGIIKQHDGYINVYSEPGSGTIFRIYLPLISSEAQGEEIAQVEEILPQGTETILLVEDDDSARTMMSFLLKQEGYTVIEAVDGEDAVKKFMENRETIDLLFSDLIMPKMNGKEAYDEMKAWRPGLKAIFASGYAPDDVRQKLRLESGIRLISKPVLPHALLKKVRTLLDEGEE